MTAMRLKRYPSASGGFALGKMGVGATMLKQGKTARDYVQDGLVAMWDGIENAGWGTHSDDPSIIKDLINNCDLSIISDVTIGQNYFWPAKTGPSVMPIISTIPLPSTIRAIKMTIADATGPAGGFGIMTIAQNYRGVCKFVEWIGCGSSGSYRMQQMSVDSGIAAWNINFNDDNNNTDVSFYRNGASPTGRETNWTYKAMTDGTNGDRLVRIRAPYDDCKIYNVALYSRALTADEIAANYAIDKERFNLP